jgi:hypothetical protein
MKLSVRWTVVVLAAVHYLASLVFLAVAPFNSPLKGKVYSGCEAFMASWQILLTFELSVADWWVLGVVWLANPFVWVAIVSTLIGSPKIARVAAWAAVGLMLLVMARFAFVVGSQPGYWSWLLSAVILGVAYRVLPVDNPRIATVITDN